jgi:hypothetical protein
LAANIIQQLSANIFQLQHVRKCICWRASKQQQHQLQSNQVQGRGYQRVIFSPTEASTHNQQLPTHQGDTPAVSTSWPSSKIEIDQALTKLMTKQKHPASHQQGIRHAETKTHS